MLVLTRKEGEAIRIGEQIEVRLLKIRGSGVRLGIVGPKSIPVVRSELLRQPPKEPSHVRA